MKLGTMFRSLHNWLCPSVPEGETSDLIRREHIAELDAKLAMKELKNKRLAMQHSEEPPSSRPNLRQLGDNVIDLDTRMRKALGSNGR